MKMSRLLISAFALLAILLASCSEYNKVLKSKDLALKEQKAYEWYEEAQYFKAYPLFEELVAIHRGGPKAEKLNYYFAYCDYQLGDYVIAGYKFKRFAQTFSNSQWAEECDFMAAYCFYINSPKESLDQTNTYAAIREMQLFVNKYPESVRIDSCNTLVDNLYRKLEEKAFNTAQLYEHTREYRAAITSYENLLNDFPDTRYREEVTYHIFKSSYFLAVNSTDAKKMKRLEAASKAYTRFIEGYPDSRYKREASEYYDRLQKALETGMMDEPLYYYNLGNYGKAIQLLDVYLTQRPDHPEKEQMLLTLAQSRFNAEKAGAVPGSEARLQQTVKTLTAMRAELTESRSVQRVDGMIAELENRFERLDVLTYNWYMRKGKFELAVNQAETMLGDHQAIWENEVPRLLAAHQRWAEKGNGMQSVARYTAAIERTNALACEVRDQKKSSNF